MSNHQFNYYFIADDVDVATDVLSHLKEAGLDDENIGVVSKDSDIVLADLPQADLSEKSKLPEALKRGVLLGSGSGLLAGVLLSAFPVAGLTLGGAAIVGMTAGGAAFGAWSASMIGVSENSDLVKRFEDSVDAEKTLIFCLLPDAKQQQVIEKTKGHKKLISGEIKE